MFTLYPAIDVHAGRVVRLRQGDYERERVYADDPYAQAQAYAQAGAQWLHLVDLDAARAGGCTQLDLLARIAAQTGLRVQIGGGVRSEDDVQRLFAAGAARVVVGSLAIREPAQVATWISRFGHERITVALDARRDAAGIWRLPVHGWTETSDEHLDRLLGLYVDAGLRHLLSTDIERDGMLSGPNLELYRHLARIAPDLAVQASGGVRNLADVQAARAAGATGVVLGRALLEGLIDLREALRC